MGLITRENRNSPVNPKGRLGTGEIEQTPSPSKSEPVASIGTEFAAHLAHTRLEQQRMSRKLFDYQRPVDEYQSTNGWPNNGIMELQSTYEMPEMIEHIAASLPIGITSAVLQLGDRYIGLYAGAATTTQLLIGIYFGAVLSRDDMRQLIMAPAALGVGPVHIGLSGWADEVFGNA
jgi:hypothetical protein